MRDKDTQRGTDLAFASVGISGTAHVLWDLAGTSLQDTEGLTRWNADEGGLQSVMAGGNVRLNHGFEVLVPRRCKNESGVDIKNGNYVFISGGDGNNAYVSLADYSAEATSAVVIGCATEDIDDGSQGWVTTYGLVRGDDTQPIDTDGIAAGTTLYLGASGTFTTTKPVAPNHLVVVGTVFREHQTQGVILVHITNGFELDELHDVYVSGTATNDFLVYDTDRWDNKTSTEVAAIISAIIAPDYVNVTGDTMTGALTINTNSLTALLIEQNGVKDNVFVVDTTNGRVGINREPKGDPFEISGKFAIYATSDHVSMFESDNANKRWNFGVNGSQFRLTEDGVAAWFTISPTTGNVGIGISTTVPTAKVHIKGGADVVQAIIQAHSTQNSNLVEHRDSSDDIHNKFNVTAGMENVFNETGANIDTRIEGDTLTHLFFLDASADYIGINTNAPSERLHVVGNMFLGADSDKVLLGAGKDMAIYYDGTDGHIDTDEVAPSDLHINCGTDKTVVLDETVYDDLQVSISNIRLPAVNYPAERLYAFGIVGGVEFPVLGFDVDEYIYFDVQTSHQMLLNSVLDNHIHFSTPNTTNIGDKFKFQLDVIAAPVNGQWTAPSGTPYSAEYTIQANDNTYHRLYDIADIPAVNSTVSTIYKCKLTRIDASGDEYASEVYVTFTDCHYQKDTMGSRQEYAK